MRRDERLKSDQQHKDPREVIYKSYRVDRIVVREPNQDWDWDVASAIAEAVREIGLIHPITVQLLPVEKNGKMVTRPCLVAGAHRLEAVRLLGWKRIPCKVIVSDDAGAERTRIGENLFRKHLTVLEQANELVAWADASRDKRISGQHGPKRRGRPRGGDAEAARHLPIGRSEEARKKDLQRARRISRIELEAQAAAIAAGLDDNQQALLKIAKASGRKAQLRKVAALAASSSPETLEDVPRPSETEPDGDNVSQSRKRCKHADHPNTTFEQLEDVVDRHLVKLWRYAPKQVRARIIDKLQKMHCKAKVDVDAFIEDLFTGREKVCAGVLYELAKARGLSKKIVKQTLEVYLYRLRRKGGTNGAWYYMNPNKHWKDEVRVVPEAQISHLRAEFEMGGAGPITASDDYYKMDGATAIQSDDDYYKM